MIKTYTKPFKITRVPALNGEWIDLHLSVDGQQLNINTSDYANVDPRVLIKTIESLIKP